MNKIINIILPLSFVTCVYANGMRVGDQALECDIGPVVKRYGETQWLMYGCKNKRSVVAVAAPGNPAMPFFFMLTQEKEGVSVYGEGDGDKAATKPAYDALKKLKASDIAALILEAQKIQTP